MSYTVLAVKWRPKKFAELVGQPHVVQALVNSLDQARLHHAYLFSGTRGVGKTTIARILAKALNCTNGIVAEPCGECEACVTIDEGRFIDLIEVDAASRTRVDDTRELLDNVQYAPTHGRFKVYLIDEVHMLSNHSFNALLKTLEEPPPHVKFLLATTDPQKLPVTVLSRCLQFHLKKLTTKQITGQLKTICSAESVDAESDGLISIARAADGSMRDALSLLDQGIAFGGGQINTDQVHAMLGSIDRGHVTRILTALADQDGAALISESRHLDELAADFSAALDELLHALQQVAVLQLVEGKKITEEHELLVPFAKSISPEDVQLYYQIALNGKRDLAWCRDERVGFEMTLLRMLAFRPEKAVTVPVEAKSVEAVHASPATSKKRSVKSAPKQNAPKQNAPGKDSDKKLASKDQLHIVSSNVAKIKSEWLPDDWGAVLAAADIRGVARQLGDNCEVASASKTRLELILADGNEQLLTDQIQSRLTKGLSEHLERPITISIAVGLPPRPTPAQIRLANENERMRAAREAVEQDTHVRELQSAFDAVVEADSIKPIEEKGSDI